MKSKRNYQKSGNAVPKRRNQLIKPTTREYTENPDPYAVAD